MIYYDGTRTIDKVSFLKFKNDIGQAVEIPMDERVLNMIMVYLNRLQPAEPKPVERGNDEE